MPVSIWQIFENSYYVPHLSLLFPRLNIPRSFNHPCMKGFPAPLLSWSTLSGHTLICPCSSSNVVSRRKYNTPDVVWPALITMGLLTPLIHIVYIYQWSLKLQKLFQLPHHSRFSFQVYGKLQLLSFFVLSCCFLTIIRPGLLHLPFYQWLFSLNTGMWLTE